MDNSSDRPLPSQLGYLTASLLVVAVVGIVAFGYMRQASVKPPVTTAMVDKENCKDPIMENRLRETLQQSPNDFPTLMDWGSYNFGCEKNYAASVAAFRQATFLSNQPNNVIKPMERMEAHFRLGLSYLYNQNLKEAQIEFQIILNEDPQNTSALFALAAILSKDKPQEAIVYLNRVIELEPDSKSGKEAQALLNQLINPKATPKP